jgi:ribosomal protein L3 glutamine methyltransferase
VPARELPRSVGALVRHGARLFRAAGLVFGHGTANARDEAAWLVLHGLKLRPGVRTVARDQPVSARAARRVLELFERRVRTRKPAAYLTREAWLGDLRFHVDERVVVPRSHIATLLREDLAPWISNPRAMKSALDLCTGSGCLAVMLAQRFPRARIDAADVSSAALAVARMNITSYRLGRRVHLVKSDLFSRLNGKTYDLIVCNPPYVAAAAMRRLPREYRHEPRLALAGGRDGLDLVRRIVRCASAHLRPGGLLVVEVGRGRKRLERAFPRVQFTWPEVAADDPVFLAGREQLAAWRSPHSRPSPQRRGAAPARRGARAPRAAEARHIARA